MAELERLKTRIPEASEAELLDVLDSARDVILSRCFVNVDRVSEEDKIKALERHKEKVLDAATVIFNLKGVEGQTSHSENGVSRSWEEYAGMKSILSRIVPKGDVI